MNAAAQVRPDRRLAGRGGERVARAGAGTGPNRYAPGPPVAKRRRVATIRCLARLAGGGAA